MPQERRQGSASRFRRLAAGAAVVAAVSLPAAVAEQKGAEQQAVAVYEEPLHRLVFSNSLVRVLDVRVPPGVTTAFHVHSAPLVGVTVEAARTRTQVLGATFGAVDPAQQAATPFDNWNATLPYTHRVENVDSVPFHYVVAERLESPGVDATVTPAEGIVLFKEGQTARIYRVEIPPHSATILHTHTAPGLTVLAVAGALVEDGDRPAARGGQSAGQWSWRGPGFRHALRNPGDKPVTVFETDLR
jgi:hypothetical protein